MKAWATITMAVVLAGAGPGALGQTVDEVEREVAEAAARDLNTRWGVGMGEAREMIGNAREVLRGEERREVKVTGYPRTTQEVGRVRGALRAAGLDEDEIEERMRAIQEVQWPVARRWGEVSEDALREMERRARTATGARAARCLRVGPELQECGFGPEDERRSVGWALARLGGRTVEGSEHGAVDWLGELWMVMQLKKQGEHGPGIR